MAEDNKDKGKRSFKFVCVICESVARGWSARREHSCGWLIMALGENTRFISESERVDFIQHAIVLAGLTPERIRELKAMRGQATMNIPPVLTGGRSAKSLLGLKTQSGGRKSRPPGK